MREALARANVKRSKVRAHVEYVFAQKKGPMDRVDVAGRPRENSGTRPAAPVAARDICCLRPSVLSRRVMCVLARVAIRICRFRKDQADRYVDRAHQYLDVRSRASDPSKPYPRSAQLTGRRSCSRGCWERALLVRSTGGSCCATAILYSVVPRLGAASPQLLFLRPAPQSS